MILQLLAATDKEGDKDADKRPVLHDTKEITGYLEQPENKAKLTPAPGRHDVYLVLTNPKKGGGLMNVDWVEFGQ